MRPYEAMVVLRPNLEQDALEAVQSRLSSVITDQGGEITHIDQWGKRRLAYEIDGHIEGFYVVIKFQGEPGITTELERIMRITDSVMRFLVIRDELPSAAPQTPAGDATDGASEEATDAASTTDGAGSASETDTNAGAAEAGGEPTADEGASADASDVEPDSAEKVQEN